MSTKKIFIYFCLIIGVTFTNVVDAQTVKTQNLSNVRVDELNDAQIRRYVSQVGATGLSDSQLEQRAIASGMKPEEVKKLRARVSRLQREDQKLQGTGGTSINPADSTRRSGSTDSLSSADRALVELKSKIFGADLFSKPSSTFEPNIRIATPVNYQVGPDDELLIDIYGYSEASYNLKVTPEGTINVPYVGVIPVGGMTIEQATARIKSRLTTIYSELRTGNTNVRITIGNIRSIKVVLTGEVVQPGTYTLPSVGSVFNALYQSGGPTENGSFREIELIRGGRKISTLDVYDFLLRGEFKNNIRLQDQDVIRVPTYRKRVEIVGEVKRPGIFEMINGEELKDLLGFSGDFTERAYQARIKVLKNTATERRITDITSSEFDTYQPSTGDKYFVDEILNRFENRVMIEGAVFRPGQFELEPGMTLKQLLQKAEGLTEDAFRNRAYITRIGSDLQPQLIAVDLNTILSNSAPDISLQREDVITVSSIFDLKEEYNIRVEGEVRQPGKFGFADGMTVEDAIVQAGGFKEGATSKRIEVSRRVRNSDALSESAKTAEVFQIDVQQDLKSGAAGFILRPFDIISVRPSEGYSVQRQVKVEGEVLYPGVYTLSKKDDRVSDLIKRAGGFTAWAYTDGASLKRSGPAKDSIELQKDFEKYLVKLIRKNGKTNELNTDKTLQKGMDTVVVDRDKEEFNRNDFVGINLPEIMRSPGTKEDLFLEEGDVLYVPKELQTVKVTGEVLSPVTVVFSPYKTFRSYVRNAGGFTEQARRKRSYIMYANGSVKSVRKILFFNSYPSVSPGSQIIVPGGAAKRAVSLGEVIGLTSSLLTIFLLLNSLK
ncbi:MAG: SLBB domain-containing protein [Phormidesmis sp. FL-bin-119]|nr:SLBB domain-containing protein [Pedobacter sp.]